jgi:uncharacterized protein (TIGR00304 family)
LGLISLGFVLIFLGMVLIMVGMLSEAVRPKEVEGRGAGIVMIGPFPIIFGTDAESVKTVIILAIILILVAFLFLTRWYR